MAWEDSLQQASFRGIAFEVENTEEAGSRALATHEYPYRNGADIEDLGLKARRFKFTVLFWGPNYFDQLTAFKAACDTAGSGALMHPTEGLIAKAVAVSWQIKNEADLRNAARVEVEFIEDTTRAAIFTEPSPVAQADAITTQVSGGRSASDNALRRRVETIRDSGDGARAFNLRGMMNQSLAQFNRLLADTGLNTVLSGLDPVQHPSSFVADVRAMLGRALQGLPFGGRNLTYDVPNATPTAGSGVSDFDRVTARIAPAALTITPAGADATLVLAHAQAQAACTLAECAGIIFAAEVEDFLLDRNDIERIANTCRDGLQLAIDIARDVYDVEDANAVGTALRACAFAVQEAAAAIILQRPPLITRVTRVAGPMRLTAHSFYADAARAPELTRLNRYGRELFITNGQSLVAYAS